MATQIIGTTQVGPGIQVGLDASTALYVTKGVTLGSTDSYCVSTSESFCFITVDGTVAADNIGIYVYGGQNQGANQVVVGESGTVYSSFNAAIYMGGYNNLVENQGTLRGRDTGITMQGIGPAGTESTVINSGTIDVGSRGIDRQNNDTTERLTIVNTGTIKGRDSFSGSGSSAVEVISNSGTMTGAVRLDGGNDTYDGRKGHVGGTVFGGAGNDVLYGGTEANTLSGGLGNDRLMGGLGNDAFLFDFQSTLGSGNVDRVMDFTNAKGNDDVFQLSAYVFNKIPAGPLAATYFKDIGTGAKLDGSDRVLYNSKTGDLYYDADGSKSGAAVRFAHLDTHPVLTAADFFVV